MSSIKTFVNQYPLSIYFILTFIISWGAIPMLVSPNGIPHCTRSSCDLGNGNPPWTQHNKSSDNGNRVWKNRFS